MSPLGRCGGPNPNVFSRPPRACAGFTARTVVGGACDAAAASRWMALLDQQCGWTRDALCRALKAKLPERAKPFTAALLRFSQGIDACSDRWPLQDTFPAPPVPRAIRSTLRSLFFFAPASHFHAMLPAKSPRSLLNPPCDPSVCSNTAGNRLFKAEKNRTGFGCIDCQVFLQPESIDRRCSPVREVFCSAAYRRNHCWER